MKPISDFNNWKILSESTNIDLVIRVESIFGVDKHKILMFESFKSTVIETENFIGWLNSYNNPQFNKKQRVHDWRNYVPSEWVKNWDKFTEREKQIIYVFCENQAHGEDWD
jgi:hypothetical protein